MAQPGGGSVDHGREPCPDRILDDIGGAFGMGAVGGGIWHLIKGAKNSPTGARTRGGIEVLIHSQTSIARCTHCVRMESVLIEWLVGYQTGSS